MLCCFVTFASDMSIGMVSKRSASASLKARSAPLSRFTATSRKVCGYTQQSLGSAAGLFTCKLLSTRHDMPGTMWCEHVRATHCRGLANCRAIAEAAKSIYLGLYLGLHCNRATALVLEVWYSQCIRLQQSAEEQMTRPRCRQHITRVRALQRIKLLISVSAPCKMHLNLSTSSGDCCVVMSCASHAAAHFREVGEGCG